ncbi:unnamed protein product [Pleuronectes platessa]|uniref:Uncharacterized protein n=1 Tax=Pleuronectes platessa TaxID=8262 RepID=A0A9N7TKS0_PLEPL|nr:unnamed protein product [Pleuronectes platessa]
MRGHSRFSFLPKDTSSLGIEPSTFWLKDDLCCTGHKKKSPFESSHSDIPPPATAHVRWSTDAGMLHNWGASLSWTPLLSPSRSVDEGEECSSQARDSRHH